MTVFRRLSYATLTLAFAQIVFGAIVRITGSGLGCGNHWPKCNGQWFPPHDRIDLIIEITHRYIAAALTVAILILLLRALQRRSQPGVGGPGGVLRPTVLATGLVVTAAIFGAVTVKMDLNPYIIVTHLSIAMTLLGVLALTVVRAGGFGGDSVSERGDRATAGRTFRSARAAAGMAFLVLVLGALTANVTAANGSCQGFPYCTSVLTSGTPLYIHITHRVLAFLLFFHLFGMVMMGRKRVQAPVVRRSVIVAFSTVILQLLVAATLVELHLPPVWRSLHQAVGTLVWLSVITMAILSRYAALGGRSVVADMAAARGRRAATRTPPRSEPLVS